jgi:hypothetical protein
MPPPCPGPLKIGLKISGAPPPYSAASRSARRKAWSLPARYWSGQAWSSKPWWAEAWSVK